MGRSRSRSRDRRRSRSRSRSRDRSRERSRGRSRERSRRGWDTPASDSDLAVMQQLAAIQQAAIQRQLMAQQSQQHQQLFIPGQMPMAAAPVLGQPVVSDLALDAPATVTNKKQRELYVGNLTLGQVDANVLRELFNQLLSHMTIDPSQPPVLDTKMDGSGRFAFVEFRTAGLAIAALQLDKLELAGRSINIGRPKGYIEPPGMEQQAKLNAAQQFAAQMSGGPTNILMLENLGPASALKEEDERRLLYDDVYMEANKCGTIVGMVIPAPPAGLPDMETGRCYIKFTTQEAATKCKGMMDGRDFDEMKIKATYSSDEAYYRSQGGEWLFSVPGVPGLLRAFQPMPGA